MRRSSDDATQVLLAASRSINLSERISMSAADTLKSAPPSRAAQDRIRGASSLTRISSEQVTALGLTLVGSLAFLPPACAEDVPKELVTEMRGAGFSDAQIAKAQAGRIVTQILPRRADNAAFVRGVVRVGATDDALADGIRKIEHLRSGGRTLQIGRFSTPPTIEDIQPLVVDSHDLDDLEGCKVGDCDLQIGRQAMDVLHAVDWKAKDARECAAQRTKEVLLAQVKAYLKEGSSAMAIYDDNEPPESVDSAFEEILADSPAILESHPVLYRYFRDFPNGPPPPNVEDFLYWSKEEVRRPVMSLVHVCLQRLDGSGRTSYCVAMKHIYDSHYFLGYAEFLTTFPGPGDAPGFYLMRTIRALIDPPRGWFRGLLLGKIKGAMRDALAKDLRRTRARLEFIAGTERLGSTQLEDTAQSYPDRR